MRKGIAAFILLFGILAVSVMYKSSKADIAVKAQHTQAAQQTRPDDLQLLKRSAVRTACTQHPDWKMDTCQAMDAREVSIGMSAEQVKLAWGKPQKVNATISSRTNREQWVYDRQYLYLEDGILRSMQSPR